MELHQDATCNESLELRAPSKAGHTATLAILCFMCSSLTIPHNFFMGFLQSTDESMVSLFRCGCATTCQAALTSTECRDSIMKRARESPLISDSNSRCHGAERIYIVCSFVCVACVKEAVVWRCGITVTAMLIC